MGVSTFQNRKQGSELTGQEILETACVPTTPGSQQPHGVPASRSNSASLCLSSPFVKWGAKQQNLLWPFTHTFDKGCVRAYCAPHASKPGLKKMAVALLE